MKKLLFTLSVLLLPIIANATSSLQYELIRTPQTPGFFAITIYPTPDSIPLNQQFVFIKNYEKNQTENYQPVLDFLSEIGATVLEKETPDTNYVTLGDKIADENNFQADNENSLEAFEKFVTTNLQPTYLTDLHAEFGGNITETAQSKTNLSGDNGITFIGKFEKEMRTRMNLTANTLEETINLTTPLDLTDPTLSNSPLATQLPNLWEDMQPKPLISQTNLLEYFPWLLSALGLLVLVFIFIRYTKRRYENFLEEQDNLQEELPWQQISKKEDTPTNPFELN